MVHSWNCKSKIENLKSEFMIFSFIGSILLTQIQNYEKKSMIRRKWQSLFYFDIPKRYIISAFSGKFCSFEKKLVIFFNNELIHQLWKKLYLFHRWLKMFSIPRNTWKKGHHTKGNSDQQEFYHISVGKIS
jgi:hypothetical protein